MMLESARYLGRIKDYGIYQSTAGEQHRTVFIACELKGRYEADGELVPCPPEQRTYFKAITKKTIAWLLADLKSIGYDRAGFQYLDPEVPDAVDLFDRGIDLVCDHETYQGSTRERWSNFRKPTLEKLDRNELRRLDSEFEDELRRAFGPGKPATELSPGADSDEAQF
jgi:hypothetical protein